MRTARERPGQRGGDVLLVAAWLGLATGFAEAAIRLLQRFGLGRRTFLSLDVVWMAPLADFALFLAAGALLAGAARLVGRTVSRRAAFTTFLFLAVVGPTLAFGRLHAAAGLLLAAGVAVAGGEWLARHAPARRTVARSTLVLAGVAALAFVAVRGGERLSERRALRALPEASRAAVDPNVLLLILDTVRASSLSLYGAPLPTTPTLDSLGGAVVFDRAWAPSPWTLPSHVALFTGLRPHETDADWLSPLGDGPTTLAEYLAGRGYATAGFVGNLIYATRETGLQRGFARYEDYPASAAMVANSSWAARWLARTVTARLGRERPLVHKDAARVNRDFLDWLDRLSRSPDGGPGRPFFAFLNYMDAHAPYVPPDSLYERFGPRRTWRARADLAWKRDWTEEELAAERAAYHASIAYVDARIGELFATLEARGLLSSTLVIIASDHGELLGEHGLVDHGNSLYRPLLHVLLLVRPPGDPGPGRRMARPVSLRDVPATIADLLGDSRAPFPGASLRPVWEAAAAGSGSSGSPRSPGSPGSSGPPAFSGPPASSGPPGSSNPPLPASGKGGGRYRIFAAVSQGIRMEDWMPAARGDLRSVLFGPVRHPGGEGGFHYVHGPEGEERLYALEDVAETRDLAADSAYRAVLVEARSALAEAMGESGASRVPREHGSAPDAAAADANAGGGLPRPPSP